MKLAAFGDLHGNLWKEFDTPSEHTGSHRLDLQLKTLAYIREHCVENGIPYALFAGDLFDTRGKVDTKVFNGVYNEIEEFTRAGIVVIMIAGNHDQYDNSSIPENSLHAFKKLKNVYVYDTVGTHTIIDPKGKLEAYTIPYSDNNLYSETKIEIVCAPYSKNAQLVKDYIAGVEKKDIPQILLFHLGIAGAFVGKGNYPMADAFSVDDLRPDLFKYIIGGHFHKRQFLGEHNHAFYTGSPIQHSFGDEGEDKGFYVVDTSKRWDVEFVPIPNPQFITLEGEVTGAAEEYLQGCRERGDYLRFICTSDQLEEWQQIIPEGLKYKVELQKEYEQQERSSIKVGMGFEEIVVKYAEENNPDAVDVGLELIREVM